MYGAGNGIGPIAGGGTGAVLAYTGTGSMVLPIVIASGALLLGTALMVRRRMLERTTGTA